MYFTVKKQYTDRTELLHSESFTITDFHKSLTEREIEILKFISEGKISTEIAKILSISKLTVETHRKNMLSKTNSKNINELGI